MSGLKWVTVSRVGSQIVTWANTFLIIRLLSPTDFGLAALAGLFASYLTSLSEFGLSATLVQRQMRDPDTLRHVFGALLALGAILTLALVLAAPMLGDFAREPRVVPLLRFIALQFIAMSIGVIPQARLSMDLKFKELSITAVGASLLSAVATLVAALNSAGAWSLIIGIVVLNFSRSILLNFFSPWIVMPKLRIERIRPLAGFSGLVLVQGTLWYWYMQIDSLVVGRLLGADELGLYTVGKQLTSIPLERAMNIINAVTFPAFSVAKSDLNLLRRGYLKVLRLAAGYAFPVFWGLGLVSEPTVRLIIGKKWLAAVPVIQLLCVSMPLRMLNSLTSGAATAMARQDVNIKTLLLAIVIIPVGVVIGSRWGLQGVASAWVVGFPFVYFFNLALLRRAMIIPMRDIVRAVWPPLAAAMVMVLALGALSESILDSLAPAIQLGIEVPAGAILFSASLWALSRSAASEIFQFARAFVSRSG